MKNLRIIALLLLSTSSVIASPAARAEAIPELRAFIESQVSAADEAIGASESASSPSGPASFDEEWYFRRFWLRVRLPAGIDVPWLAKFQIVPEVELLWQREYPAGWGTYKP
jgi:hypothetical protein